MSEPIEQEIPVTPIEPVPESAQADSDTGNGEPPPKG